MFNKKFFGFSLGEVIMAIAIIAVLAAILTPSVMLNLKKTTYLNLLKKTYTELEQNLSLFSTKNYRGLYLSSLSLMSQQTSGNFESDTCDKYGTDSNECKYVLHAYNNSTCSSSDVCNSNYNRLESKSREETVGVFFKKYYAEAEVCGTSTTPCFASKYSSITKQSTVQKAFECNRYKYNNDPITGYSVRLKNGVAICIVPPDIKNDGGYSWDYIGFFRLLNKDTYTYSDSDSYLDIDMPKKINALSDTNAVVYIDVNGPASPNVGGRDMFTFNIYNDYTIDEIDPSIARSSSSISTREELFNNNCKTSYWGKGCFSKILLDKWKINY